MIKKNNNMESHAALPTKNAVLILLNYFLGYLIIYPIIGSIITLFMTQGEEVLSENILIVITIFTTVTTYFLAYPLFKAESNVVENQKWKKIGKTFFFMYVTMLVLNPLIAWLTQTSDSQNQLIIIDGIQQAPFYVILSALIMAPVVEEIVFRGVLYRKIRNVNRYVVAVFISAFSFGFLHVLQSVLEQNWIDFPFIIVYIALGLFFVKIYEETGKLSNAILLHFINNLIGVVAILVLMNV